jgi:WXG100 family type VII secretion target
MSAPKVRGDYEALAQIAQTFGQAADQSRQTLQNLQSQMNTLQQGDWVGKSADKFYAEMNSAMLPTMKRLVSALERARSVTQQISRVIKQAEDDSAALFKGAASGVASGGSGAAGGAGSGSGGSSGGATSGSGSGGSGSGGSGGSGQGSSSGGSGQPGNDLLARDPNSLFKDDYMKSLVDSKFQGADSKALRDAMNDLSKNPPPTGAALDSALSRIAEARGRPVNEIKAEYDKFLQIKAQRDATNPDTPPDLKWPHGSFQGSTSQMRYGKVVGDAFGVDPVFGSMLNPTGGMVGPGNVAFDADSTAVGYHGIVHDAAGYLHNYHKTGPGYDYLGREGRDTSDPLSGQREGIKYWRDTLGDYSNVRELASIPVTGLPVSQSSEYLMRGVVFAADTWNKVKSFF